MTEPSALHRWLQAAENSGTLDSQGEFTIELSKAWEKLGSFQLPFAEAWVLKLVQAAVSTEGCLLEIRQSREETAFHFRSTPHWNHEQLEAAVFEVATRGATPVGHLALAVRALALKKTRPFSITYANGESWAWTGKNFAPLTSVEPASTTVVRVTNYLFGQSTSLLSLGRTQSSKMRAEIVKTLSEHCHLGGVNVTLDSRSLDGCLSDPWFGKTARSHPIFVAHTEADESWEAMKLVHVPKLKAAKIGSYRVSLPPKVRVPPRSPEGSGSAAIISTFFHRETIQESLRLDRAYYRPSTQQSEVLWVREGVLVKREPLQFFGVLGLGAIVSAEGLETDLTGLVPLENEAKKERLRCSLKLIEQTLRQIKEKLGPNGFQVSGNKLKPALTGMVGTTLLFAVPWVGAAVLAKAGHSFKEVYTEGQELESAYNNSFEYLLSYLRDYQKDTRARKS